MEVDELETKTLANQESGMTIENKSKAESDEDDGKLLLFFFYLFIFFKSSSYMGIKLLN